MTTFSPEQLRTTMNSWQFEVTTQTSRFFTYTESLKRKAVYNLTDTFSLEKIYAATYDLLRDVISRYSRMEETWRSSPEWEKQWKMTPEDGKSLFDLGTEYYNCTDRSIALVVKTYDQLKKTLPVEKALPRQPNNRPIGHTGG